MKVYYKLIVCAVLVGLTSVAYGHPKKNIKYEIVSAQIKPYISNSFGNGYMGLQETPKEPGYGIFYTIKIPLKGADALTYAHDDDIAKKLVCDNIAIKPLLMNLYTVSLKYMDENDDLIINLVANKVSCGYK
ncbi:hypothetical protein E1B77_09895 [Salmonella enterica subsp. enterica]|nr:hypothetical protein [Salmonella enterica subsp. enterica]